MLKQLIQWLRTVLGWGPTAGPPRSPGILRFPLATEIKLGRVLILIPLTIAVRTATGTFVRLPFLLDSRADFTHIPLAVAERLQVPYATDRPADIKTVIGVAERGGYFSPLHFSFPGLPQWQFETLACFSRFGEVPLLSISDLLRNFSLSINPQGAPPQEVCFVLLVLRDDHTGTPRG